MFGPCLVCSANSNFAIISQRKREMFALISFSSLLGVM